MRLRHITFTGIDAKTDIRDLQEIQNQYPIVEFGVLTSYHWYENGNRYLDPRLMRYLYPFEDLKLALHVCGSAAHDAAEGEWDEINHLTYGFLNMFHRIQLNISGRTDNPISVSIPNHISQEVIIQQKDAEHLDLYNKTIETWHEFKENFSVLLDASGGQGIDTPIRIYQHDGKIGYAGGINPDNVADKLAFLLDNVHLGRFWIDMESGVRTDDWFDLDKVVKVLETCDQVIKEHNKED